MRADGNNSILDELFGGIMSEGSLYEGLADISIHADELLSEAAFQETLGKEDEDKQSNELETEGIKSEKDEINWSDFKNLAVESPSVKNLAVEPPSVKNTANSNIDSKEPKAVASEEDKEEESIDVLKARVKKYCRFLKRPVKYNGNNIKDLKAQLSDLAKEIVQQKKLKQNKKINNSSNNVYNNELKVKKEEQATNKDTTNIENKEDEIEQYNNMTTVQLMEVVRPFLIEQGVKKHLVNISTLTSKFGKDNIRRLIKNQYLVVMGGGVSMD